MKKTSAKPTRRARATSDEIQPEYDWSKAVRNPYAARYAAGTNIVVLEPDVAALFPNASSVNEALRSLASVMAGRKRKPTGRRRTPCIGREGARQGIEEYLEIKYVAMGGLGG